MEYSDDFTPDCNLGSLTSKLKDSIPELAQVPLLKLQVFTNHDDISPIHKSEQLASLSTTFTSPLIVHYPLSDYPGN